MKKPRRIAPPGLRRTLRTVAALLVVLAGAVPAAGQVGEFLLLRRDLDIRTIRLIELNDRTIVYRDEQGVAHEVELTRCLALLNPAITPSRTMRGLLSLADGQRLPGQPISATRPSANAFAWMHPWLDRLEVPLEEISAATFVSDVAPPAAGDTDTLLLANGDRLEGFVLALGDPITIEVEREGKSSALEIPLDRAVAVALITPPRTPQGRRIWFIDGTVADVQSLRVGDDGYLRLSGRWITSSSAAQNIALQHIAGVLFDPAAMRPLSMLEPTGVEGPETRFTVPAPEIAGAETVLDMSAIEYRGPVTVRYATPAGARRFAARAEVAPDALEWGDFDLIVRSDDRIVFREHLDAASPVTEINVELSGSELTIEMRPGRHGPIQDKLILRRAVLLVE